MKSVGNRSRLRLTALFRLPVGDTVKSRQVEIEKDPLSTHETNRLRHLLNRNDFFLHSVSLR